MNGRVTSGTSRQECRTLLGVASDVGQRRERALVAGMATQAQERLGLSHEALRHGPVGLVANCATFGDGGVLEKERTFFLRVAAGAELEGRARSNQRRLRSVGVVAIGTCDAPLGDRMAGRELGSGSLVRMARAAELRNRGSEEPHGGLHRVVAIYATDADSIVPTSPPFGELRPSVATQAKGRGGDSRRVAHVAVADDRGPELDRRGVDAVAKDDGSRGGAGAHGSDAEELHVSAAGAVALLADLRARERARIEACVDRLGEARRLHRMARRADLRADSYGPGDRRGQDVLRSESCAGRHGDQPCGACNSRRHQTSRYLDHPARSTRKYFGGPA